MKFPKHYSLKSEEKDHYLIHDKRDNTSFKIAKGPLDESHHKSILKIQKFADGGDVEFPDVTSGALNNSQDFSNPTDNSAFNQPEIKIPEQQSEPVVPPQSIQPGIPDGNTLQTEPVNNGIIQKASTNNIEGQVAKNMKAGEAAVYGLGEEKAKLSAAESQVYKDTNTLVQDAYAKSQEKLGDMAKKNDDLYNQISTMKVDPNKYVNNMSTTNKILSAIAIGFGGINSGLTGRPNAALEILHNSIEKDVEAQKANISNKHSLYAENLRRYGDERAATQATISNLNSIAQGKIAQLSAQHGDPIAKQNAAYMLSNLKTTNAVTLQQLHAQQVEHDMKTQAMSGNFNPDTDPATLVKLLVPEHHQAKAFESIEAAQNTKANAQQIMSAFKNAAKSVNAVDFVPGMQNADQKQLHALLGPTFKDVEGTVRQAAMDNLYNNATPQFGDSPETTKKKEAALVGYINSKGSSPFTKGFGIDLNKFNSTKPIQSTNPNEGMTATNSKGQRIIMKNGSWVPYGK